MERMSCCRVSLIMVYLKSGSFLFSIGRWLWIASEDFLKESRAKGGLEEHD